MRLKQAGAETKDIENYVIRPSHELTEQMLKEMIIAEDIRSSVHMIHITAPAKALKEVSAELDEKGSKAVEKPLDEFYVKLCRWFGFTQFFSIAPIMAYISLKENEVRNIRAIVRMKADGVPPQEIKEVVRMVPKFEL